MPSFRFDPLKTKPADIAPFPIEIDADQRHPLAGEALVIALGF